MSTTKQIQSLFSSIDLTKLTKIQIKNIWNLLGKEAVTAITYEAQEFIYDAWETPDHASMVRLTKKAFNTSPFCLDAYCILATLDDTPYAQAKHLLDIAIYAGDILYNEELENDQGYFWGIVETRPYMRTLACLANLYEARNKTEKSIEIYRRMLVLNPEDNQGIRYPLLYNLIKLKSLDEANEFIKQHEENSAFFLYSKALLAFMQNWPDKDTIAQKAIASNPHICAKLTGLLAQDRSALLNSFFEADDIDAYSFGGEDEALLYIRDNLFSWTVDTTALAWLRDLHEAKKQK